MDMPTPHVNSVPIHHPEDKVSQWSQMDIFIFINQAPIIWYSKWQNMVETNTFGSEFIMMKIAVQ